jgi:methionyl aminopeptidase
MQPMSSRPIPYRPDPSRPAPPIPPPSKALPAKVRAVQTRLAKLRQLRRPEKAAYKTAVWKFKDWPDSTYTGPLRAGIVAPRRVLGKAEAAAGVPRPDYAHDGQPTSEMQEQLKLRRRPRVLGAEEVRGMRQAGVLGREVLDIAALAVRPGVRCDEIDTIVHEACLNRRCYPSPLNYMRFPKSVCTSVNEVICHGVPDSYELQRGDIINIDVTVYHEGYHADLNETYFVGGREAVAEQEEGAASLRLVQTAYECLFRAIELVKPGELYRNLGAAIQPHAEANGCSVTRS